MHDLIHRPRRLRKSEAIRSLIKETKLSSSDFVLPIFISENVNEKQEIASMPNVFRHSIKTAIEEIKESLELGISSFALFPAILERKKDSYASESKSPDGFLQKAIKEIKNKLPSANIISDVAMDPYSCDGHDGLVKDGEILNDETIDILCEMAISQAKAGVDFVAPSDMMDGRVIAIRNALDENGFSKVGIISYSAKYCSCFYGPFRDALDSAPKSGDKKSYQMDFSNTREALLELALDAEEGADILMIKPALSYLDIISKAKQNSMLPIAAYNVSGEYSMLHLAAQNGLLKLEDAMIEVLTSIKRAGADITFTYFAKDAARLINS